MGYDRISALPDHLITEILLWLLTGDSVKTSVLSTRWRNLWLDVPGLDFKLPFTNTKASFIERFLEFNRDARLRKFKLTYHRSKPNKGHPLGIREWIATAISRGAQHLEVVEIFDTSLKNKLEFMPLDIYKSKTLVSLNLVRVGMSDPDFVVFLPCLKNMYLEQIMCSGKDPSFMEKLISGCPVLEGLTVSRSFDDNVLVLRVRSKSLKRFSVWSDWGGTNGREFALEIDAPGLKYMNLGDHLSQRIVVKNLRSLFMIDIDSIFNAGSDTKKKKKKDAIGDFLNGISRVRHMIISQHTMEVFNRYLGSIPTFNNVYRLEASCNTSCNTHLLQVLPDFLESFPNLRHLTLCLEYFKNLNVEKRERSVVPRCLLSTLECVEIRELITGGETWFKTKILKHKKETLMNAARYILENSLVLKKLILILSPVTNQISDITKELRTFRKGSRRCNIFKGLLHSDILELIG